MHVDIFYSFLNTVCNIDLLIYCRNDSNETSIIDPYASDMHFVALNQRSKRGFFEGLKFRLQAPEVDWRKLIGSEAVGASFGIKMENYLDLKIGLKVRKLRNCNICFTFPVTTTFPMTTIIKL